MENFENPEDFENRELLIDGLINKLGEQEDMSPDDILSDIITFAPYEGNETINLDYLDQVAEMLGISAEEMRTYAVKKAKDYLDI
jgi:hypothetical protein